MHEISQKVYKAYVFVCENQRTDGRKSCGVTEPGLRLALKEAVRAANIPVRVVSASCMDCCVEGPTVMIVPMVGTPALFGTVHIDDIPEIVRKLTHDTEAICIV